jgi:hypothetical protein
MRQLEGCAIIRMEGFWLIGVGSLSPDGPQTALIHTYPILNFPLITFIITLIANSYFLIRLRSRE